MTYEDKKDRMESIAIIGMAGRFPGAENVNELWENIKNGVDSRVRFSDEKLLKSGVQQSLVDNPHYVKSRCVLEDAELFDASFLVLPQEKQNIQIRNIAFFWNVPGRLLSRQATTQKHTMAPSEFLQDAE